MYLLITKFIKFLKLTAYTNILLALGAAISTYVLMILTKNPFNIIPFLALFLITFTIYNLNRQSEKNLDSINHPERTKFSIAHSKKLFTLAIVAYILAILLAFLTSNIYSVLLTLFPLFVVTFYTVKISKKIPRLKDIFLVKNLLIAFTWAFTITFLTVFYLNIQISYLVWFFFLFMFIRFFINVVTFDMRDFKGDKKQGVRTLPVVLGFNKTKSILYVLNGLLGVFLFLTWYFGFFGNVIHIINLSTLYGFLYIYFLGKTDMRFLCDVIIDGEYIIIGFLAFVGSLLLL